MTRAEIASMATDRLVAVYEEKKRYAEKARTLQKEELLRGEPDHPRLSNAEWIELYEMKKELDRRRGDSDASRFINFENYLTD